MPSVGHNRNEPGKAVTGAVTPPAARDEAAGASAVEVSSDVTARRWDQGRGDPYKSLRARVERS
jgi:hypothetical protein